MSDNGSVLMTAGCDGARLSGLNPAGVIIDEMSVSATNSWKIETSVILPDDIADLYSAAEPDENGDLCVQVVTCE